MKKLLAILFLAGIGVLVTAVPALAAGAIQTSFDPTGAVFQCGATAYTVTGGVVKEVIHEGTSASGNMNVTGTIVPQNVTLTDGTTSTVYRLVGADWFGGAMNAQTGGFTFTDTEHFQIFGPSGGPVGTVQMTTHVSPNGQEVNLDLGNCLPPAD